VKQILNQRWSRSGFFVTTNISCRPIGRSLGHLGTRNCSPDNSAEDWEDRLSSCPELFPKEVHKNAKNFFYKKTPISGEKLQKSWTRAVSQLVLIASGTKRRQENWTLSNRILWVRTAICQDTRTSGRLE